VKLSSYIVMTVVKIFHRNRINFHSLNWEEASFYQSINQSDTFSSILSLPLQLWIALLL